MNSCISITLTAALLLTASSVVVARPTSAPPAQAQGEVVINASMETVWKLMSEVDRWSEWNNAVDSVHLYGSVAKASVFVWKTQGFTVTSTLQDVEPMKRLSWTGKAIGTQAFHKWEFEAVDGKVLVRTLETFDGWLPWLMTRAMQKTLDETLPKWLATLKAAAEAAPAP